MKGDFNRIIQDVEMAGQNSPNLREISELQNEGGSDVFTSTRHINNTENVRPIFQYIRLHVDVMLNRTEVCSRGRIKLFPWCTYTYVFSCHYIKKNSKLYSLFQNSDYKLKFWTQDDAPIIRPLLKTERTTNRLQHGKPAEISMGVNSFKPDGYGGAGCERVTKLGARTTRQTYLGYGLLVLGSATVCALLVKMKQPKKSSQQWIKYTIQRSRCP